MFRRSVRCTEPPDFLCSRTTMAVAPRRTMLLMTLILVIFATPSWGQLIRRLIQDNLSGRPENFQVVSWNFDPDVAERRRIEFEEKHGMRGERLIARLGQGMDGFHDERRKKQIENEDVERQFSEDRRKKDTQKDEVISPRNVPEQTKVLAQAIDGFPISKMKKEIEKDRLAAEKRDRANFSFFSARRRT